MVRACSWCLTSMLALLVLFDAHWANAQASPYNLACVRMANYAADGRPSEQQALVQTMNATVDGGFANAQSGESDEVLAYAALSAWALTQNSSARTVVMQAEAIGITPIGFNDFAPQCDTLTYVHHEYENGPVGAGNIGYVAFAGSYSSYRVLGNEDHPGGGVNPGSATAHATASLYLMVTGQRENFIQGTGLIAADILTNAVIAVDVAGGRFAARPMGFGQWQIIGRFPPAPGMFGPQFYFAVLPDFSQLHIPFNRATNVNAVLNCAAEVSYQAAFAGLANDHISHIATYKGVGMFYVTVP